MTQMTTDAYNTEPVEHGAYILRADMTMEEIEGFRQVWQNMVQETGKQSYVIIVPEAFDITHLSHEQLRELRDACNVMLEEVAST